MWGIPKYNNEISRLKVLRQESVLHPLIKNQIKQNLMAQISLHPQQSFQPLAGLAAMPFGKRALHYLAPILGGLVLFGGTVFASGSSNPGDTLYPVKRAREAVILNFTKNPQTRAKLITRLAQTRLEELQTVQAKSVQGSQNSQQNSQLELSSRQEVRSAIKNLMLTRAQLRSQGLNQTATEIEKSISSLRTRARRAGVLIPEKNENE